MSDASTIGDDLTDLAEAENGTIRLDAIDANHVEYRDPYTGITRDIWRPGTHLAYLLHLTIPSANHPRR